jgi:DNA repair protein SbcC/Rad50
MWIQRVTAHAFGPFKGETLELAEGMTVVYGPNEAGKSSWHAAIYAALCGVRARRGGPTREEREFRARRHPWDGDAWRVSCLIGLPDGRRVELDHDLANQVGTMAKDVDLGSDVSGEIENQGTPDGSRWLGLERQSFLAVASIRQAEVMSITAHADALQDYLQRAAATSGAAATAAAALEAIDAFKSEHLGLRRANSTRPLQTALNRVRLAEESLEEAHSAHDQWLSLVAQVAALDAESADARRMALSAEAVAARRAAEHEANRHREASELAAALPSEPPPVEPDPALAEQVAAAVHEWRARPSPVEVDGPDTVELERRLASLPPPPTGDLEPDESVVVAHRRLLLARDRHKAHSQPELDVTAEGENVHDLPRRRDPAVYRLAALSVVALASGSLLLASGATAVGAVLVGLGAIFGSSAAVAAQRSNLRSMVAEQIATSAATRQRWEERGRALGEEVEQAVTVLAGALAGRGVEVPSDATMEDLEARVAEYEDACRRRRALAVEAAARPGIEQALSQQRRTEEKLDADRRRLESLRSTLAEAVTLIGGDAGLPEEELEAQLVGWQAEHRRRSEAADRARAGWARLEAILGGDTLEDLEARARRLAERASRIVAELPEVGPVNLGDEPEATVRDLRQQAEFLERRTAEARRELEVRQENIIGVAAAEEALAHARAELDRLERLEEVLDTTRGFLVDAQERVHRTIAPLLAEKLQIRLAQITDGRYREVTVDPESLHVQVRDAEGRWRDASVLSHGTAEQIYLLLRVAMAEVLTPVGASCPLLLDDTTVHSDSDRTLAVLDVLHEVSADHQVVLFTQEQDVLAWARESLGERDRLGLLGAGDGAGA